MRSDIDSLVQLSKDRSLTREDPSAPEECIDAARGRVNRGALYPSGMRQRKLYWHAARRLLSSLRDQRASYCLALFVTLGYSHAALAREATDAPTPQACIVGLSQALREGDLGAASRFLDLSKLPPGARDEIGERASLSLGLVLDTLDAPGWRDPSSLTLPTDSELTLGTTPAGSIQLVNVALRGESPNWRFSDASVRGSTEQLRLAIPAIRRAVAEQLNHIAVFDFQAPEVALSVALPDALRFHILGLAVAQWLGLVVVVAFSWFGARVFSRIIDAALHLAGRHRAGAWRETSKYASRAFAWTAALKAGSWALLGLGLPIPFLLVALLALKIATIACFAWTLIEIVALVRAWVASPQGVQLDDLAARGIARIAQIIIVAGALLAVVSTIGERDSVNHAVAALGIGGIAVGLAVQDPLKNYFAGLVLAADRPFRSGDRVLIDSIAGTIIHIGARATTVRTDLNSTISIPNAMVASARIESEPIGGKDLDVHITMLLPLTTTTESIAAFREGALIALKAMRGVRADSIELGLRGNNDKGIEFGVTLTADATAGKKSALQDAVMLVLIASARDVGAFVSASR